VWEHRQRYFSAQSHLIALMMEVELVSETLDLINSLTRLSARKTFINMNIADKINVAVEI
jgi:hypothetical protein